MRLCLLAEEAPPDDFACPNVPGILASVLNALAELGTLRLVVCLARRERRIHLWRTPMASKKHNHSRRNRRRNGRRIASVVAGNWLLEIAARTIATVAIMVAERLLGVPR